MSRSRGVAGWTLAWVALLGVPQSLLGQDPPGIIPPPKPRPPVTEPAPPPNPKPSSPSPVSPGAPGTGIDDSPEGGDGTKTDDAGEGGTPRRPDAESGSPDFVLPPVDIDVEIDSEGRPDWMKWPDIDGRGIDDIITLDSPTLSLPADEADAARPWGNPEGYLELREHLQSHGFTHVIQLRITRLQDGRLLACLPEELAGLNVPLAIGVVSESRTDDVDLMTRGTHAPDSRGDLVGVDDGPELTAAVGVRPSEAANGWCFEATTKGIDSNERLLVVVASSVGTDWPGPEDLLDRGGWRVTPPSTTFDPNSIDLDRPIVVIPIHGTFGLVDPADPEFFTSADFENAVETAVSRNPSLVLLEFDSGGGRVDTKEAMLREMLARIDQGVRFVCTIREAGSTAAMLAFGCELWLATPDAKIGAAVTYLQGSDGTAISLRKLGEDDPELRAKFESFDNALNIEAALLHGRHPQLVSSMCFMDESLWWDSIHGFDDHARTPESKCLDDEESILTLTRSSLVETGLAAPIASLDSFLAGLGLPSSITVQRLDRQMRGSSRRLGAVRRKLESGASLDAQDQAIIAEIDAAP